MAVKVRKCNETVDKITCKDDKEIARFLKQFVFTTYVAQGVAELGNQENYIKSPIKPIDKYF